MSEIKEYRPINEDELVADTDMSIKVLEHGIKPYAYLRVFR